MYPKDSWAFYIACAWAVTMTALIVASSNP